MAHLCKAALHDSVQGGLGQISCLHHLALLDKLNVPNCATRCFGHHAPNAPVLTVGAPRYDQAMSGVPADLPPGSAVVLTNPDEDASPEAFRAFIDELLAGPEPELESVDAAAALRALRADAQA